MQRIRLIKITQNAQIFAQDMLTNENILKLLVQKAQDFSISLGEDEIVQTKELLKSLNDTIKSAQLSK